MQVLYYIHTFIFALFILESMESLAPNVRGEIFGHIALQQMVSMERVRLEQSERMPWSIVRSISTRHFPDYLTKMEHLQMLRSILDSSKNFVEEIDFRYPGYKYSNPYS